MGLFDRIFGGRKREPERVLPDYKALTVYNPVFTSLAT